MVFKYLVKETRAVDLERRFKLGLCSTRDVEGVKAAPIDVVSGATMCSAQFASCRCRTPIDCLVNASSKGRPQRNWHNHRGT